MYEKLFAYYLCEVKFQLIISHVHIFNNLFFVDYTINFSILS